MPDQSGLVTLTSVWNEIQLRDPHNAPDLIERFHLGPDDDAGRAVVAEVTRTWATWLSPLRWQLLAAINWIVQAENAKSARKGDPQANRRYRDLAKSAVQAAQLAKQIATWFPPPWDENTRPFLMVLVEWAVCGLHETARVDRDFAMVVAGMMIEQLRDDLAADGKKIPFELIGKLAWLATGREEPFDESTMRRYGRNVTPTGPAAKYWRRHFHLMIELGRLVPGAEQSQRFREAMHAFLQPPRHH